MFGIRWWLSISIHYQNWFHWNLFNLTYSATCMIKKGLKLKSNMLNKMYNLLSGKRLCFGLGLFGGSLFPERENAPLKVLSSVIFPVFSFSSSLFFCFPFQTPSPQWLPSVVSPIKQYNNNNNDSFLYIALRGPRPSRSACALLGTRKEKQDRGTETRGGSRISKTEQW